jgi:hypothetical protein
MSRRSVSRPGVHQDTGAPSGCQRGQSCVTHNTNNTLLIPWRTVSPDGAGTYPDSVPAGLGGPVAQGFETFRSPGTHHRHGNSVAWRMPTRPE